MIFPLLALALSVNALLMDSAQAEASLMPPAEIPHTYTECATSQLNDDACHRQIIEAGGTVVSAAETFQEIEPRDFDGKSHFDRWYNRYVALCRDLHARAASREKARLWYPGTAFCLPPLR